MFFHRRATIALVLLLSPAFAKAELTAKPNAYTESDRLREQLEWNQKTIVEAYQQIGNKNPAWDTEAIKFLDAAAQHFGRSGFGPLLEGEAPKDELLITLGEAAVKKGCDDPMVLY